MIIQRVIKGISDLNDAQVQEIFATGIVCNWWRSVNPLPRNQFSDKLTPRNLDWHQNQYDQPDPLEGNRPFRDNTPFISTTAGTVSRDVAARTNRLTPAWRIALQFATDTWKTDGWLFYCHLFLLGRPAVGLEGFAEEVRDLNVYQGFSPFQPEGEITAKIVIPSPLIEYAEHWDLQDVLNSLSAGTLPTASKTLPNPNFVKPDDYNNLRSFLL